MTEVLSVASEVFPLVKTGGLADVAGALPLALGRIGVRTRTLLPAYPTLAEPLAAGVELARLNDLFGGPARLVGLEADGLDLILLDAPHLFDRPGGPYVGPNGYDHPDNWARFAALGRAGALVGQGLVADWRPEIVHAHDWQAALAPVYLSFSEGPRPRTVLTIHNLAFQGAFPQSIFADLGLPARAWSLEGLEYYGSVGFLKGGLHATDAITTVSPNYASEILQAENGMGLDGLLRGRADALTGIVNGIDTDIWDPNADPHIPANYSTADLFRRQINKRALEAEFALAESEEPILAVVSRLTWQKGLDVLAESCDDILAMGCRLVVVGSGDRLLEGAFLGAAARHAGRMGVRVGYDELLSHRVQAGADALLVPSRFEPCGLTQLYALRYGCLPVVSRVGGLADTVIDANFAAQAAGVATGVIFAPVNAAALQDGVARVLRLYADPALWRELQITAMRSEVGWSASARRYKDLYSSLLQDSAP